MSYELKTFEAEPYSLPQSEKEKILLEDMKMAVKWHYEQSPELKNYYENTDFDPKKNFTLDQIPYLPITIFKSLKLRSVAQEEIIKTLYSSSTSGIPSTVFIDQITADYQKKAIMKILSDFLGKERRHFLIFDTEATIKATQEGELSSRGTAIRGMLPLAKSFTFLLTPDLKINYDVIEKLKLDETSKVCFFSFTWLAYNIYLKNKDDKKLKKVLAKLPAKDKVLLHIGGWKKLTDIAVSKDIFNADMEKFLSVPHGKIIDVYGMTEQLGTVYPDCEAGHKHLPLFSDIFIRNIETLQIQPPKKTGFIQFISPIPHSYPGISLLSDDIGRIEGIDDCPCGRKGKYFIFERRSEKAELRGCGDTFQI